MKELSIDELCEFKNGVKYWVKVDYYGINPHNREEYIGFYSQHYLVVGRVNMDKDEREQRREEGRPMTQRYYVRLINMHLELADHSSFWEDHNTVSDHRKLQKIFSSVKHKYKRKDKENYLFYGAGGVDAGIAYVRKLLKR